MNQSIGSVVASAALLSWPLALAAAPQSSLQQVMREVVGGFAQHDAAKVRRHIHPQYGYVYVSRAGAVPSLQMLRRQEFVFATPYFGTQPQLQARSRIRMASAAAMPKHDCERWNKAGWYYRYASREQPFSALLRHQQQYEQMPSKQIQADLQRVQPLEAQLVKMVYIGKSRNMGDELHLYFSKIGAQWYFSAYDNSGACAV